MLFVLYCSNENALKIPQKYENHICKIIHNGNLSESAEVKLGVRQDFVEPSSWLCLDRNEKHCAKRSKRCVSWGLQQTLEELAFADDICF